MNSFNDRKMGKYTLAHICAKSAICSRQTKVSPSLISTLRTCSNCNTVETRARQFPICSQCKQTCYCSQDCQRQHWRAGHKAVCKKPPTQEPDRTPKPSQPATGGDLCQIVVMLGEKDRDRIAHWVPRDYTSGREAVARVLGCGIDDLVVRRPLRGEPDQIDDLYLVFDSRAKAKGKPPNLRYTLTPVNPADCIFERAGIILTPLVTVQTVHPPPLVGISRDTASVFGDVAVLRIKGDELVDFTKKEFKLMWGIMQIMTIKEGWGHGTILGKTKENEQMLASTNMKVMEMLNK